MSQQKDMAQIRETLESYGGITNFPMWELRDAVGYGKLGRHVVVEIANRLDKAGIGHLPDGAELPRDQNSEARLYLKDHKVGTIVRSVLQASEDNDEHLRDLANTETADATEVLEQVRAIVCPGG